MQKQILILKNPLRDLDYELTKKVVQYLVEQHQMVFILEQDEKQFPQLPRVDKKKLSEVDFAIMIGGDGTLLGFAAKYLEYNFPFFGINMGRVGALAEADIHDWREKLELVLKDQYFVEERSALDVTMKLDSKSEHFIGFNEVAIVRGGQTHSLHIQFTVLGEGSATCYADGILVATPTGSSAYSLSAGGSLVLPSANAMVILPICPQVRSNVPIITSGDSKIMLSLDKEKERVLPSEEATPLAVIDGHIRLPFLPGNEIRVKKAEKQLRIIKIKANSSLYAPVDKVMKANMK